MLTSRRIALALGAACISPSVSASPALAAGPATVTVRVEGLTETLLPATQVTTTTEPVVKDGKPEDSCSGTSSLGALQIVTGGNWSGPWDAEFKQYEIYSIEGENHVFEEAPANYYWSFWLNHKEEEVGACEAEPESGEEALFFPACFGEACPPAQLPLGIQAPPSANVGEKVSVTVNRYSTGGVASPANGASVAYEGEEAPTDSSGHATLEFAHAGELTVRVSAPESVRTEAIVCVHNGNDGTCGTPASSGSSGSAGAGASTAEGGVDSFKAAVSPYKGPYALVADVTGLIDGHVYRRGHAPRILSGTIFSHSAVSSISLELRREYGGRCYAYEGIRERFLSARCGEGALFKVSGNGVFSYLLPSALAPGRYVLDVQATDVAGNRTTLARGTSRIVFYVR